MALLGGELVVSQKALNIGRVARVYKLPQLIARDLVEGLVRSDPLKDSNVIKRDLVGVAKPELLQDLGCDR